MPLWKRKISAPEIPFEAFGVQLKLTLGDSQLEPYAHQILPPGWRASSERESAGRFGLRQTGDDAYEVTVNGASWLEHATLAVALVMLDAQIRLFIAANARDWTFVHAGVVARDDHALVIPGESFSGKTTLVSALVEAGATYYSDEYAVLDEAGLVHPYPRPLSIRNGDGVTARERVVAERGAVTDGECAPLATVVITRYRAGAEWQPKRLSAGQGLVALLANTVPARARPEQSLRTLRRAVAGATMFEGDRGEAGPVASALLDGLGAPAH